MSNGVFSNYSTVSQIPFSITSSLLHPNKTHNSIFSIKLPNIKLVPFHVKISTVFASKTQSKGEISPTEMEEFDFDEVFDEDFEEEEEEEDEEIIVPLKNMKQWARNKPSGFGEGKVYDTSVEDKLMEEIEQSKLAQVANLNNLKNNPQIKNPNSKKEKFLKQKASEVVPNGIRVRLVHLPKKKNIHRDLQAAFKEVSGIINIIPLVSGNEKTREPVCKGLAFVDFKSEKAANRFVDTFSSQPITFGKVQKQIKCEIMKPTSSNFAVEPSVPPSLSNPILEIDSNLVLDTKKASFDSLVEDSAFDKFKNDNLDLVSTIEEFDEDSFGNLSPVPSVDVVKQENNEQQTKSKSPEKQKKVKENGKKIIAKRKGDMKQKLNVPGSATRLKIKDKALLSGVFSKYGVKATMAVKEES